MKETIVILGGGYAGLQTALVLSKKGLKTILIDKNNGHELLPELPYRITEENLKTIIPFEELLKRKSLKFIQAEAEQIDYYNKQVKLKNQEPINFDYLVLALGSQTNYFNIPGLKENSIGFISTKQVDQVNKLIEENFDKAKNCQVGSPEYYEFLSVIVGGGGLTGVEVAGELLEKLPDLAHEKGLNPKDIKIYLIEGMETLMPAGDKTLSQKITDYFREQENIELLLKSLIKEAAPGQVKLADGKIVKAKTILWTGGIRGNTFFEKPFINENGQEEKWPLGRGFRLEVDEFYRLKGRNKTYAAGDNALIFDPETGNPFPLNGQAALKQGRILAKYILADIQHKQTKPSKIKLDGVLVSLGDRSATGTIWNPVTLSLPVGWLSKKLKDLIEFRYRKFDIRK